MPGLSRSGYEMRWVAGDAPMQAPELPLVALAQSTLPMSMPAKRSRAARLAGHIQPPGTGPRGETCGSCHHRTFSAAGVKSYSKCRLNSARWTHGRASDVLKSDPSCSRWEKRA